MILIIFFYLYLLVWTYPGVLLAHIWSLLRLMGFTLKPTNQKSKHFECHFPLPTRPVCSGEYDSKELPANQHQMIQTVCWVLYLISLTLSQNSFLAPLLRDNASPPQATTANREVLTLCPSLVRTNRRDVVFASPSFSFLRLPGIIIPNYCMIAKKKPKMLL